MNSTDTSANPILEFAQNIQFSSSIIEECIEPAPIQIEDDSNPPASCSTKTPARTRGTFVTPAPNFDIHLQRTKITVRNTSQKQGNIQNGNLLALIKYKGKKIVLINTCSFDSISEIVSNSCAVESFKEFLEQSQDPMSASRYECYVTAMLHLYTNGVSTVLYTNRVYILASYLPVDNGYINCNNNVAFIFQKLMYNYDTIKEVINCDNCLKKVESKKYVVPIPNTNGSVQQKRATERA